ncbi:MAG TPA: hypothetical protein VKB52_01925 [Rhodanobacteraceae bacterium]|nr:hypothetical protein [Rhodanobacteraceae bacterium]
MISTLVLLAAFASSDVADDVFRDGFNGDACPAGRLELSDVEYHDGTLSAVDVTSFDTIWGRYSMHKPPAPFPAGSTVATILDFDPAAYLGARLVIEPFVPDYYSGLLSYTDSNAPDGPHIDLSISTDCADFSPSLGLCVTYDSAPDGMSGVGWGLTAQDPQYDCELEVGHDYYVNIRFTDPPAAAAACPDGVCAVKIYSGVALP